MTPPGAHINSRGRFWVEGAPRNTRKHFIGHAERFLNRAFTITAHGYPELTFRSRVHGAASFEDRSISKRKHLFVSGNRPRVRRIERGAEPGVSGRGHVPRPGGSRPRHRGARACDVPDGG